MRGVSGDTTVCGAATAGLRARCDRRYKPDLFILELGGNDLFCAAFRRREIEGQSGGDCSMNCRRATFRFC